MGLTIAEQQRYAVRLVAAKLGIWVAHGEVWFCAESEDKYNIMAAKFNYAEYPGNPNRSDYNVAGICSADGRHLAMMPHLERSIFPWQNAYYPRKRQSDELRLGLRPSWTQENG